VIIEPGTKLQNRYEILSELGRGGMGAVFKARDPLLDRIVAIKTLSMALSADDSFVRRFQHEARAIARLNHPGIVGIFDVGQETNVSFIVMEFIPGGSLEDLLKKERPLPPERVIQLLTEIAIALDFAHGRGFVHRDIKPANILLDEAGKTRITDFGLVKEEDINLTLPGQIMGTPRYMAPEQIQGDDVGPAADIYSLGIVAYEMLAGEPPFTGAMSTVFDGHVRREPPLLRELNPALPEGVETVIRRVLSKTPEQRFDTAVEFVNHLRPAALMAAEPVGATQLAPPPLAPVGNGRSQPPSQPPAEQPAKKSNLLPILAGVGALLLLCFCAASILLMIGRGDGGAPTAVAQATQPPTAAPTTTPTPDAVETPPVDDDPTPDGAGAIIASLEDARQAVVQIEAQGSFVDPQVGLQLNQAGRGSGFIIDASGLAVTNNHVVTGAALLRVYLPGEQRPRNARVLGVSECFDLAVIQIEGDDFSAMEWYSGEIRAGQEVYAAGFPLGDPEYTLTSGIISAVRIEGVTDWAALDYVLQHNATINPGSSGGPLLDSNGRLVGVNYASAAAQNQYFAIGRDQAMPVINQLRQGQDVYSIGINGVAVTDGAALSGIWISSVKAGSPADRAGLLPGDILTTMQGLLLATDGTMGDYCAILRSHASEDTLSIEVLRFDTGEILVGQINGRILETKGTLEAYLDYTLTETDISYDEYLNFSDELDILKVEIPAVWSDLNEGHWTMDGERVGRFMAASADLDAFYDTWIEPGIFFGASRALAAEFDASGLLDRYDSSHVCAYDGRYDYDDSLYTGLYDFWYDCDESGSSYVVAAVTPADGSFIILLQIILVTDADFEAVVRIFDTFIVADSLP
jgi:serine protease Do